MDRAEYRVCTRCIMDTSDPEITFDAQGICNHCREAEEKLETAWFRGEKGARKLQEAAREIKAAGVGREYDCIVGVSGGVDSSYLLHVAKKLMSLRPLVVHVDAGWNSEIAVQNIESLVKALELDLFTYVVDWEEMRDLQLAFLESSVANQDIPQDHAFDAKLHEFAIKNDITWVLSGNNLASESILPASWGHDAADKRQLSAIHKRFGKIPLKTFPTMSFFENRIYWPYGKKMKRFAPLNCIDYDKNKAITFLEKEYGWRYYGGKHHESKWTKFFQAYYLPVKFGADKRKAHLSSLIIAGQMVREEALREMEKPLYDPEELKRDKEYVARKLGLSVAELEAKVALPNKTYKDYPNEESLLNAFRTAKRLLTGRFRHA